MLLTTGNSGDEDILSILLSLIPVVDYALLVIALATGEYPALANIDCGVWNTGFNQKPM